jgi:hypothetical protein
MRRRLADGATRAAAELDVEEKEMFLRENNPWQEAVILVLEFGAIDAKAGDSRRVREEEGNFDREAGDRFGFSGCAVLALVVVGLLLEENPAGIEGGGIHGGVGCGGAGCFGINGRGLDGTLHDSCLVGDRIWGLFSSEDTGN